MKESRSNWNKKILIVIPTLNEVENIVRVLRQLDASMESSDSHIFIIDGGSTDGTLNCIDNLLKSRSDLTVIENKRRLQAVAVNMIASLATENKLSSEYIVRVDAHAEYPEGYVNALVEAQKESASDSVVVPMETVGGNPVQNAARDLFNSWLGNGGAAHRGTLHSGYVEHGHHALFSLSSFNKCEGYDESFEANEDAEFDYRLRKLGGKIFMPANVHIKYVPRESYLKTYMQYRRNGFYRVKFFLKHKKLPGLRQVLPLIMVPSLFLSIFLGVAINHLFLLFILVYLLCVLILSILISSNRKMAHIIRIWALAVITHTAYSIGGLMYLLSGKKKTCW